MSRIGKQPVTWSSGTKVSLADGVVTVETGKGKLRQAVDRRIQVQIDEGAQTATFERQDDERQSRAMHGLYRMLIANMVEGLEKGFEKNLEIHGVGYTAKLEGKTLVLNIGFNAPVKLPVPQGIECAAPKPTSIKISGADKQAVGQFAAEVRAVRKPEPYKGKGIRYVGEYVRRKVGKSLAG